MGMKYINIDINKWVEVDEVKNTSRIVVKSDVEDRLSKIDELKSGLTIVTDEEYLSWAKEHYPVSNDMVEVTKLETEKQELETLLGNLK